MSVKFKCIASGNIITFTHEVDIVTTRENPAYVEIKEEIKEVSAEEKKPAKKTTTKGE